MKMHGVDDLEELMESVGRLEEVVTVTLMPARLGSMTARSTFWATMPNPTNSES